MAAPDNPLFTFATATTELQLRLGNRSDIAARIPTWLNSAQLRMGAAVTASAQLDIKGTPLVTTPGVSEYDLLTAPTVVGILKSIYGIRMIRNDTTGVRMRRFPWVDYRELNQQAQSQPMRWVRYGNTLAIDPQPENPNQTGPYTLLIDARKQPAQGTLEIDNVYQEAVVNVAEFLGWSSLMKPDRAAAAMGMVPLSVQQLVQQPLDQNQWESMFDPDQGIRPQGFEWAQSGYGA